MFNFSYESLRSVDQDQCTVLRGHSGSIYNMCFLPDPDPLYLLSCSKDTTSKSSAVSFSFSLSLSVNDFLVLILIIFMFLIKVDGDSLEYFIINSPDVGSTTASWIPSEQVYFYKKVSALYNAVTARSNPPTTTSPQTICDSQNMSPTRNYNGTKTSLQTK